MSEINSISAAIRFLLYEKVAVFHSPLSKIPMPFIGEPLNPWMLVEDPAEVWRGTPKVALKIYVMIDVLFEVTPAAIDRIRIFFEGRTIKPIRIQMNDGFCVSSGLSLAVEGPEDGEVEFEIENYKFYIHPKVLETMAPIKVDFSTTGFKIHSAMDRSPKCPGCGKEGAWCLK